LLDLLRRHGAEAEAFRALSPDLRLWTARGFDAALAYVRAGRSVVGVGSPICAPDDRARAMSTLIEEARAHDLRVQLFAVEEDTLNVLNRSKAPGMPEHTWVSIGEQPAFDLSNWSLAGRKRANVRAQVHRAANHGVRIKEVPPHALARGTVLRAAADALIAEWREHRPMSPMGFLVDLHPFLHAEERRYFIAEKEGELEGLLSCVPIHAKKGWFLEDLIRRPRAPNGTSEALVCAALSSFAAQGYDYATLGVAALSSSSETIRAARQGVPSWLIPLFRFCYRHANALYSFRGIRAYREKFRPDRWEKVYLVVSPPPITARTLFDLLNAFIPGTRLHFVLDSAIRLARALAGRIPTRILRLTAWAFSLLLFPWIWLLLSVDPLKYFGSSWGAHAWVVFDVAMAAAFALLAFSLTERPRFAWSLARIMLGAVLADLTLTTTQALLFNFPNAEHTVDVLTTLIAILAPASAAFFLTLTSLALQPRDPWHLERRAEGEIQHTPVRIDFDDA